MNISQLHFPQVSRVLGTVTPIQPFQDCEIR
jgi:hypothetical protein